jgi:hypothetical protein
MELSKLHLYIFILFAVFAQPLKSQTFVLIDENTPLRTLVPDTTLNPVGEQPVALMIVNGFEGSGGIGYGTNYGQFIKVNVGDKMYHESGQPDCSCIFRIKFQITEEQFLKAKRLILRLRYDDGFQMSLNGIQIISRNAPFNSKFNALATD